jgi:hypothetical protein
VKTVLKLALFCSVALAVNSAAHAQSEDRLTAEKEEVIKLAKKFSERYEQTKSLEPLIGEFFTPRFNHNLRKAELWQELDLIDEDNPELNRVDMSRIELPLLRRLYAGVIDAMYLSFTLGFQAGCVECPVDTVEDAEKLAQRHPFGMGFEDGFEQTRSSTSRDDVKKTVARLEFVSKIYRRHLRDFPKNKRAEYHRAIAHFEKVTDDYFDRRGGRPCETVEECGDLPLGTRGYIVTVPPAFFIYIAQEKGRLRIFEIVPFSH